MSKELWMIEHERVGEEYPHSMDREEAVRVLTRLGFDPNEIEDQLSILENDNE